MSSTVQVGGFEISSSSESAEEMVKALTPEKDKGKEPVVLKDRGQKVEPKPADQEKVTEAARELGKRGGEAAAKAREEKAKEPEKEAKSGEAKPAEKVPEKAPEKGKEAEPPEPGKKGDPRHDPEARVRVATQQAAEARRHFEEAQARAEELAERLERLEKRLPPEPKSEAEARPQGKPTPDQFDNYEEFAEALTDWKLEQRLAEREQAQQRQTFETAQDARIQKHVSGFRERMGKAIQADPEFIQRIDPRLLELQTSFQAHAAGNGIGPGEVLADLYTASEHGPEILLHLTEHPEEVVRLIRCEDPVSLAREFGKIEARMAKADGEPPPPKPTASKAPPPLTPVGTSATETEPDIFGEISFDEFRRRRGKR